jgi:putative nucleotidyltransferase with HDIG domain
MPAYVRADEVLVRVSRSIIAGQVVLFTASVVLAGFTSESSDWKPISGVAVLLLLAIGSDLLIVPAKSMRISGSFQAMVLAMALLGPAPAVFIGVVSIGFEGLRSRVLFPAFINNLATYATFPLVGGLLIEIVGENGGMQRDEPAFLLLVLAAFTLSLVLNFVLIATYNCAIDGTSLWQRVRTVFVPVLPSELAAGLLSVGIAYIYVHVGVAAFALLAVVLFTFQYLLGELLVSQERAEELENRSMALASLQVGVLTAMIQTLSLRDRMTARHSAAVARYAREIAKSAGYSEADQDLVHTAGLLHDIGKFIFPDSILFADKKLSDEDWEIVKRHPAQGAKVVRKVDGYGPVADIILCHHERIDGKGYPRGLRGDEVPMLSRMISIADTYDVMTARDSYRDPVTPSEAIAELRRVSGSQLDGELVEVFIKVLESKGIAFRHLDDADFEAELEFERRVRVHAEPAAELAR